MQQTDVSSFSDTALAGDTQLLSLFTMQNNAYEKERLQIDERQKEANEEWKQYLQKDAALKIAYKIIIALQK